MKKAEIKVGGLYAARVSGNYVTVRVDAIREVFDSRNGSRTPYSGVRYDVTNLSTGRKITFHSAAKFRSEVRPVGVTTKQAIMSREREADLDREQEASDGGLAAMLNDPAIVAADTARSAVDAKIHEAVETVLQEASEGADPTDAAPQPESALSAEQSGVTESTEGEQSRPPTDAAVSAVDHSTPTADVESISVPVGCANVPTSLAARIAAASATKPSGITLTPEQERGLTEAKRVEAARNNGQRVLVIKAGAGSGKTFELQQMEQVLSGNGQYTAYNASLCTDSKTKFKRAAVNTTHSLAFRAVGVRYKHRLNGPRVRSGEIAVRLGISDYCVELPASIAPPDTDPDTGEKKPQLRTIKARYLAGQVTEAVKRFCQSADPEINAKHFSKFAGIDEEGKYTNSDRVKAYLLPFARKMWADLADPNGTLPFQHDVYVKLWELGRGTDRPVIAADYIMLDEYQDTAPVMVSILQQQTHAMLVLVGDDNQRIYEWRGAINAGDEFPNAPRCNLSKSFRFGQAVADVANAVLAGLEEPTDLVMKGLESIPTRVCQVAEPRCYLYRTNAGAIGKLMSAMDAGKRGHLIGGSKEVVAFCRAAIDLQAGRGTDHPELGCFGKWSEVQEYSKEDEGADLKLMVKLIDDFGANRIIQALENMPAEKDADLILSTAHRSKGREWASVKLGQDFPLPNQMGDAERRLVYVAATRAQEELDISECPTFCGGWNKKGGGEDEDGVIEAKWIPGIKIDYTVPMPTAEDLAAYRAAKAAPKSPTTAERPVQAATPAPAAIPAPTQAVGPANGNGSTGEFTWASLNGGWGVRGPKGAEGKRVTVTRKNGTTSTTTLGKMVREVGEFGFYEVR